MSNNYNSRFRSNKLSIFFVALTSIFTFNLWAQETPTTETPTSTEEAAVEVVDSTETTVNQTETQVSDATIQAVEPQQDESIEQVTVTGSRIRRDTFSSISPLQILSSDVSRQAGLLDAGDILQGSGAATGQQIDLSFNGFVLDNGPGAKTISLRGLSESRTLVLINGRRIAPAGVEGAPVAADLNLIPNSLVQQYDILLDGASSIYGSDAIAGVVNAVLKKDFDGLEMELFSSIPSDSGGESNTLSMNWGKNSDRGFIAVGAEYTKQERLKIGDRKWTRGCDQHREIDENGNIRTQDLFYSTTQNMTWDECRLDALVGRVSIPAFGSVYYIDGNSNTTIPNLNESSQFGIGIDTDEDGVNDVGSFRNFDRNGKMDDLDFVGEGDAFNVMSYGEHTFSGDMNITPFFEALYNKRNYEANSSRPQLFPVVPATNPFNPCGVNGVDCGLAYDALLNNPAFAAQVANEFGLTPAQFRSFGIVDLYAGAIGPAAVQPIVAVRGDRSGVDVEIDQIRFVTGIRGDLPQLNIGSLSNWSFESSLMYTKSSGKSSRLGIRGDRLNFALGVDPNTGQLLSAPCVANDGSPVAADVANGCVPVNLFASSLYNGGNSGDFATAAERNYLFDSRDFDTDIEQTLFSLYLTGDLFETGAGAVKAAIGAEYRLDDINSIPDAVARDGLFFGFFSDGGAVGDKYTKEAYAELEVPLLANLPAVKELTANVSGRYTKDEFAGSESTYSLKVGYRPVDSLLLRFTQGTSFRAPNLHESFLLAQTGFPNVFDPCFVPENAINALTGGYDPTGDNRSNEILSNCLANGVDPTANFNAGFNTYSVESARGGQVELEPETSDSESFGFAFEQPWFESFGLHAAVTRYKIDVNQTIIDPSAQFIVNDCYNSTTGNSVFCSRISRDSNNFIDFINSSFINRDEEKVEGWDYNLVFNKDGVVLFDRPVDFRVDLNANKITERSTRFIGDDGTVDSEDFAGEFGFPEWKAQIDLAASFGDYTVSWRTNYIGSTDEDPDSIDPFDNIFGGGDSDTCLGPDEGDVNCRDLGSVEDYTFHTLSVYYRGDQWTIGAGIRNIFNDAPPEVDTDEALGINNVPIGLGYDYFGRRLFFNVERRFD